MFCIYRPSHPASVDEKTAQLSMLTGTHHLPVRSSAETSVGCADHSLFSRNDTWEKGLLVLLSGMYQVGLEISQGLLQPEWWSALTSDHSLLQQSMDAPIKTLCPPVWPHIRMGTLRGSWLQNNSICAISPLFTSLLCQEAWEGLYPDSKAQTGLCRPGSGKPAKAGQGGHTITSAQL